MPIPQDPEPDYEAAVDADDLDPEQEPLAPTGDDEDADDDDVSGEPGGDLEEGDLDICPPPACVPARECTALVLLEASWEMALEDGDILLPFDTPQAVDWIEVTGEVMGDGGTIEVWQSAALVGSAPFDGGPDDAWTAWAVLVAGTLDPGVEAEVRIVV